MASIKIWSGLKIPKNLSTRLQKYGSRARDRATRVDASLARRRPGPTDHALQAPECLASTLPPIDPPESAHSDLDFLHQIGSNRFPALDKGQWWGVHEGIKSSDAVAQLARLKSLVATLCEWSAERAQSLCCAASKMLLRGGNTEALDPTADMQFSMPRKEPDPQASQPRDAMPGPEPDPKASQPRDAMPGPELDPAPGRTGPAPGQLRDRGDLIEPPVRDLDGRALMPRHAATLRFDDVLAFRPPYPRLQPNSSKFVEGLLNGRTHFVAVRRAFGTSADVTAADAVNAAAEAAGAAVSGGAPSGHDSNGRASTSRKTFLKSCSGPAANNVLNRESYTRETINKMASVIKRLPSIADVKKAEQKQKQRAELKSDETFEKTFEKNVYFLGKKCLNAALKDDGASEASSLQRDVDELSRNKATLSTEVTELSEQVQALSRRQTDLKAEIAALNDQFHAISSENREMFKVKEATFNLVEELCLRRDALAQEEEALWLKLERLNKRIAEKYKMVNPYGEYSDDSFTMQTMLCAESDVSSDESKAKAGQFLHRKICPAMQDSAEDSSAASTESGAGGAVEQGAAGGDRAQVKAMIMEANKHRFRRCELPFGKTQGDQLTRKATRHGT